MLDGIGKKSYRKLQRISGHFLILNDRCRELVMPAMVHSGRSRQNFEVFAGPFLRAECGTNNETS